jgi:hypothetical protein
MIKQYKLMFGNKPKEYTSPLEEADHPEIDISEELDQGTSHVYNSMIGPLQWVISLGHFDIQRATTTMSCLVQHLRKVT